MTWKSIAVWPPGTIRTATGTDESDDTHDTKERAEGVCRLLRREGYGGEGRIFPLSTRVEEVTP